MTPIEAFLMRNSVRAAGSMPVVHSTSAYRIAKLLRENEIKPMPCDVFKGENLSYFFFGRPAYKTETQLEAEYWQMPACVIMNYEALKPKRIYPFDTGAFRNSRYPDFISIMELEDFEISNIENACQRLIGAFFVTPKRYFSLQPRNQSSFERAFHLDMLDTEVKALYKLALSKSTKLDDRRFAIEMQCDKVVKLNSANTLAIIFPEEYCESHIFMQYVKSLGAEPLTYQTFPLKKEFYYYAIYEQISEFYHRKGFMK